jgi:hypothetical protein
VSKGRRFSKEVLEAMEIMVRDGVSRADIARGLGIPEDYIARFKQRVNVSAARKSAISHRRLELRWKDRPKTECHTLPVAESDFIRAPSKARLMARR